MHLFCEILAGNRAAFEKGSSYVLLGPEIDCSCHPFRLMEEGELKAIEGQERVSLILLFSNALLCFFKQGVKAYKMDYSLLFLSTQMFLCAYLVQTLGLDSLQLWYSDFYSLFLSSIPNNVFSIKFLPINIDYDQSRGISHSSTIDSFLNFNK